MCYQELPMLKTFVGIVFFGNLISLSILPSFLGQDAAKLFLYRRIGGNFKDVLVSIILTRIAGVFGLLLVGLIGVSIVINGPIWDSIIHHFSKNHMISPNQSKTIIGIILFVLVFIAAILALTGRRKIHTLYRDFAPLFRLKIFVSAVISQVVLVTSISTAILAVGSIEIFTAFAISSISALFRVIPLSLFGVTLGDGVLASLLITIGWNVEHSVMAAGLITIFVYLSATIGFLSELFNRPKPSAA